MPGPGAKDLRAFILRGQVLSQYREFLRATGALQQPAKGEVRAEIRREFEAHRGAAELSVVKFCLSEGKQRLKQLTEMLMLQR